MKYVFGCDIGFGDVKLTVATEDGDIIKQFKFPTVLGVTKGNEHLNDDRIIKFKEHSYYVGEDALILPSESMIDITDYDNLEYYAPLMLYKAIKMSGCFPDVLITGLSKAQIQNSGYFKENLQEFTVNGETMKIDNVFVLPQGAGSKMCIDKYGDNFPQEIKDFTGTQTYVGCDIGFNTLDMFMVSNGLTSAGLFEGIENEGVMKIAKRVAAQVYKEYDQRKISLHEAKEIIDSGVYQIRGKKYDMKEYLGVIKKQYLGELLALVEKRYGKILDKCDFISLSGGGSTIFETSADNFLRVPKTAHEFYNSIGFTLFGLKKLD